MNEDNLILQLNTEINHEIDLEKLSNENVRLLRSYCDNILRKRVERKKRLEKEKYTLYLTYDASIDCLNFGIEGIKNDSFGFLNGDKLFVSGNTIDFEAHKLWKQYGCKVNTNPIKFGPYEYSISKDGTLKNYTLCSYIYDFKTLTNYNTDDDYIYTYNKKVVIF